MKKQFLIIGSFLTFGFGFSQNTFPTSANTAVGIGTGTTAVPGTGGLRLKVTSGVANTSGVQLTNLTSASPTTTGLLGKALSVNATGNLVLVPVANSDLDTSIYNTDGTLSANRTVNMNAKNLTFNPTNANSQFFINGTNGNVGIGNLLPSMKLDVNGGLKVSRSLIDGQTYANATTAYDAASLLKIGNDVANSGMLSYYDFPASNFTNNQSLSMLHIDDRNDFRRFGTYAYTGGRSGMELMDKTQNWVFNIHEDNDVVNMNLWKSNSHFIIGGTATGTVPYALWVKTGTSQFDRNIFAGENIGIGTSSFTDGTDTYRLSVNGAIRAHRVKVYTTWADFVFEKDYDLPTLEEVEKHIKDKGHLIDIPSAKTVEENGIELGEMNKKLLQKIEELTLYVIELNKEVKELKSKNN